MTSEKHNTNLLHSLLICQTRCQDVSLDADLGNTSKNIERDSLKLFDHEPNHRAAGLMLDDDMKRITQYLKKQEVNHILQPLR
jgi:hypothetical protein